MRPNAAERLVVAALELFEERGYENTTVSALELVGSEAFTRDRREFTARRRAVIAANPNYWNERR